MTYLITGATGFIGRNVLRELTKRGEPVIAVSRRPEKGEPHRLVSWRLFPKDTSGWHELLARVKTVCHFAWSSLPQSSNEDPIGDVSDNLVPTLRLLEAIKHFPQLRLVFASSGGTVYGVLESNSANESHVTRPRCAYGVSKLAAENYLTLYNDIWGVDCVSLRISNPYGSDQKPGRNFGAISTFASRAARREPVIIFGDGSVTRDFIHINDLVEAIIAASNLRGGPTVINIGSGVGKSLTDIVDVLRRKCQTDVEVSYREKRNFDVPRSVLDLTLAKEKLNWSPRVSFDEGVRATFEALAEKAEVAA